MFLTKEQEDFDAWLRVHDLEDDEDANVMIGMFDVWKAGQKELQELSDRECPSCHYPNDEGRGNASD